MSDEIMERADHRLGLFVSKLLNRLTRTQVNECLIEMGDADGRAYPDSYSVEVARAVLGSSEMWSRVRELSASEIEKVKAQEALNYQRYHDLYYRVAPAQEHISKFVQSARGLASVLNEVIPGLEPFEAKERW